MKNKIKKGFTLIELLVVILIIGVLSAIVFPQYRKAVERTKYVELEEFLNALSKSQERYYLDHNRYSEEFGNLDIEFPKISGERETGQVLTTKYFEISLADVNEDNTFAKASRKKGGNTIYSIYKNLNTGQVFCADSNPNDDVTCNLLGVNSEAYKCDDESISITGAEGCPSSTTSGCGPNCVPVPFGCFCHGSGYGQG